MCILFFILPGLAALWGAWVGRGVVVAGRLHTRSFTLELFPCRRQRLVYRAQNVSRLGLWEKRNGKWQEFELGMCFLIKCDNNVTVSEVWLSSPFLVWRMTSSLVGDNFLCCWNSETGRNLVSERLFVHKQRQLLQKRKTENNLISQNVCQPCWEFLLQRACDLQTPGYYQRPK